MASISMNFIFKRGDLLGVKGNQHVYGYVIAQVIRYNRFFYCKDILTGEFRFIVFDSESHFIICPNFDPDVRPDIDIASMGSEFYDVLDRLFDFSEEESSTDW